MVIVLSVPRSGTRFYWYFVTEVLGLPCKFAHFYHQHTPAIVRSMSQGHTIIVPRRSDRAVAESFDCEHRWWLSTEVFAVREHLRPLLINYGAHFMDIEKSEATVGQFEKLLAQLDIDWAQEVTDFIDEWRPIGSQFDLDDERSKATLKAIKQHRLEGTAAWQH